MPPPPYPPPTFDAVSAVGIAVIALAVSGGVIWIWHRYLPATATRATIVIGAWMLLTGTLAATGVLSRLDLRPPPAALLIAGVLALAIGVGLSPIGRALAAAVPLTTLVELQVFRLPLEGVMHRAGEIGIMPPELSYGGYNFDIVTGGLALALGLALQEGVRVPRAVIWAWNLWGLWCLAVIAAIAVATSPMVRAFGDDPRHVNTWVLHLPYVWLPAVLVMVALAGHVVLTRKLLTTAEPAPYTSSHR